MSPLRTRFSVGAVLVAAAIGAAALGCSRKEHIREDFGVQTREFFDRQARSAEDGQTQGLDSEEAALIHQSYRGTMGGQAASRQTRGDPASSVLILEDGYETRSRRR